MKTPIAFLLVLFSVSLYAANPNKPPPDSPPEPVFVGYSIGTLTAGRSVDDLWIEAATLCKDAFGSSAIAANSDHIKAAINDGTFFPVPAGAATTYALFIPVDSTPGVLPREWGVVNSDAAPYVGFSQKDSAFSQPAETYMVCAQ